MSDFDNVSPFFQTLRPNLLLCKCFATCSLGNLFKSVHVRSLTFNQLSFGLFYELCFVIYFETTLIRSTSSSTFNISFIASFLYKLVFFTCFYSDNILLLLIQSTDEADKDIVNKILPQGIRNITDKTLTSNGYKWLICFFLIDCYLYWDINCKWSLENVFETRNLQSLAYQHIPFISSISLFCTISSELSKRTHILRLLLQNYNAEAHGAHFLEDCRCVHAKYSLSIEMFCQCFSTRILNQLLILVIFIIHIYCFPCFHGEGCIPLLYVQGLIEESILVVALCYCSSKFHEKNEEILEELNLISLNNMPYKCKEQVEFFSSQIVARPLKVTAWGFFDVDMTTILAVFSVVLMYTVIVAQLSDRLQSFMA